MLGDAEGAGFRDPLSLADSAAPNIKILRSGPNSRPWLFSTWKSSGKRCVEQLLPPGIQASTNKDDPLVFAFSSSTCHDVQNFWKTQLRDTQGVDRVLVNWPSFPFIVNVNQKKKRGKKNDLPGQLWDVFFFCGITSRMAPGAPTLATSLLKIHGIPLLRRASPPCLAQSGETKWTKWGPKPSETSWTSWS